MLCFVSLFSGILARCHLIKADGSVRDKPFGSDVFVVSTLLDPNYSTYWIDVEINGTSQEKKDLQLEIMG